MENQSELRKKYLQKILHSDANKILIVAGPGTGKTYTFKNIFNGTDKSKNLAITFINLLEDEMERAFGGFAEVKTFHSYCKKQLHQYFGKVEIKPYLPKIILIDALILGHGYQNFEEKFRALDVKSNEAGFYIARSNYYQAFGFDDGVFRLLELIKNGTIKLSNFERIVVDEFQDFNPLEVEFINELEKRGRILIVGDDDQAVYDTRCSSPAFIREKYNSGQYEIFQLPFCTRCPKVIVEATNAFIVKIQSLGYFRERIDRVFLPYLEGKEYENSNYTKIITAQISHVRTVNKYLINAIRRIPTEDIEEAKKEDYPCALIVGQKQHLNSIYRNLKNHFNNIKYKQPQEIGYEISEGYKLIFQDEKSNLGWRIIAEYLLTKKNFESIIIESAKAIPIVGLLPKSFIQEQKQIIELLKNKDIKEQERLDINNILGKYAPEVLETFFPTEIIKQAEYDESQPSILLTSFQGCKGISGGHVFIVGLNKDEIPKLNLGGFIKEVEFSKFIVAMTRTRKQCTLLSNYRDLTGKIFRPSEFMSYIPDSFLEKQGYISSKDIL